MTLIRRVAGRRATAKMVCSGWAKQVEDPETGDFTEVPINKPVPPWSIRVEPPPLGAVKVTRQIAAWFNRVGYYHFTWPSVAHLPQWEGYTKAHGGLYVATDQKEACRAAEDQAWDRAEDEDVAVDWAAFHVRVEPGDFLAVDEDHWNYIQEPYLTEKNREQLRLWGAGSSLDEFAAATDADSMWRAPRAWGEAFVLRWSAPIIKTCVHKGLVGQDQVPNLRVWSTR